MFLEFVLPWVYVIGFCFPFVIAYKILACIILHRLKKVSLNNVYAKPIWFQMQNLIEVLLLARRAIDYAIAHGSPLHLIELDLSKVFDTLMPHALFRALNTFGIPSDMISMIKHIY